MMEIRPPAALSPVPLLLPELSPELPPLAQPASSRAAAAAAAVILVRLNMGTCLSSLGGRPTSSPAGCPSGRGNRRAGILFRGRLAGGRDRGVLVALDALLRLVEDHREDDDRTLDRRLPEGGDADDHESVAEEADDEGTEEHAADVAASAGECRAADDDSGDGIELERLTQLRSGAGELGGEDDASRCGAEAADHVDPHLDPADGHACQLRGPLVASGRVDPAAVRRPPQHQDCDEGEQDHDPDAVRYPQQAPASDGAVSGVPQCRVAAQSRIGGPIGDEQCRAPGDVEHAKGGYEGSNVEAGDEDAVDETD